MSSRAAGVLPLAVAVLFALTACGPPTGAVLVAKFASDVESIDGVERGDAEAGPIEVELESGLSADETSRVVADVVELLASDTFREWEGHSLQFGAAVVGPAPLRSVIRWSGGAPESTSADVEIWLTFRGIGGTTHQELVIYDTTPSTPSRLVVCADEDSVDGGGALEEAFRTAWAAGDRAQEKLAITVLDVGC